MRKKIFLTIFILVFAVVMISACTTTTFTVTYEVDGQVYTTEEVNKGGTPTLPKTPEKAGYVFDHWCFDKDKGEQYLRADSVIINDVTVYAFWKKLKDNAENNFTVSFDSQGGSDVAPFVVKKGDSFTLPTPPTKADYNFEGWFLDTAYTIPFTTSYTVTKNIIVYAKWTPVDTTTFFKRSGSVITEISLEGKKASALVLPEKIDGVSITALGEGLFKGNQNLKSITFPKNSSYVTIGKECFRDCTSLEEIKFINGISNIEEGAFRGCTSITSVNLPTSVTKISKDTFRDCKKLKYANLQNAILTEIGEGAYANCEKLVGPIKIASTVKSIGAEAFMKCAEVSAFNVEDGVESIGDRAFFNCAKTSYIRIPDTVTSLGVSAFADCKSATSAYIGSGITSIPEQTFLRAIALDALTISEENKITSIGKSAFAYCYELENFTIPSGVQEIGEDAFRECKDITSFTAPSGLVEIKSGTFLNALLLKEVTLHANVTAIGNNAFMNCGELTTLNGMLGLTDLGAGAFAYCKKLEAVTIPGSVENVKTDTFKDCHALKNLTISDGVKSIGDNAFSDCYALEELVLPSTMLTLGKQAFSGSEKLASVTINSALENLSSSAFDGCITLNNISIDGLNTHFESDGGIIYSKGKDTVIFYSDALENTTFTLPEGVKVIEEGVFEDNQKLQEVTLPTTLEDIGDYAFYKCEKLTTINFPLNLKSIGNRAFYGTKITSLDLPVGVHTIEQSAFENATALVSATLPITLISVGKNLFYGANPALTITVEGDENALSGWSGDWDLSRTEAKYKITYGEGRITAEDYVYFVRNNRAVLTSYLGSETSVVVPETIEGHTVYGLYKTFNGKDTIKEVLVPDSVEVISEMTFKGTSLEKMCLPFVGAYRGATGAGALLGYVFDYSENKVSGWSEQYADGGNLSKYYVEVPKTLYKVTLTDSEVIPYGAFSNLHDIVEVVLPGNLKKIGGLAFYLCSLIEVRLPASLEIIEKDAFSYNYNYKQENNKDKNPTVTFNTSLSEKPEGWVEGCFGEGFKINYNA